MQNHGLDKKKVWSGVFKTPKDYDFDSTTVSKPQSLLHPNTHELLKTKIFCKTVVLFHTPKILCIQTKPKKLRPKGHGILTEIQS